MNIFRKISFTNSGEVYFEYIKDSQIVTNPLNFGTNLTLKFNSDKKICTGYFDMEKKQVIPCSENSIGSEQCALCRTRSGFNPAFYHATTISTTQDARNHEPHILYLADFGGEFIKVGIAYHKRKLSRLLEQGARAAIILDELPTANVARNYEAKITKLPNFVESVRTGAKLKLLSDKFNYDSAQARLKSAHAKISDRLNLQFNDDVITLDGFYAHGELPTEFQTLPFENSRIISGQFIALVGNFAFFCNSGQTFIVNTKDFAGYQFGSSNEVLAMDLPEQQTRLF